MNSFNSWPSLTQGMGEWQSTRWSATKMGFLLSSVQEGLDICPSHCRFASWRAAIGILLPFGELVVCPVHYSGTQWRKDILESHKLQKLWMVTWPVYFWEQNHKGLPLLKGSVAQSLLQANLMFEKNAPGGEPSIGQSIHSSYTYSCLSKKADVQP